MPVKRKIPYALGVFFITFTCTGEQGIYEVMNYMELEDIDLTIGSNVQKAVTMLIRSV